jgi:methionyl-tRNA formyltransferase
MATASYSFNNGGAVTEPQNGPPILRLLFVTEDDPLYVVRFFEVFFDEYPKDEIEVVGVSIQNAFGESLGKTARRMWRLYGPFNFARLGVRYARAKAQGVSIASLVARHGLPLVPCGSVNEPEYIERVRRLKPDVIASVAAPEIFRASILAVPRLGCINIHSGRLPVYRGMMPTFWQLLHGETHVVITVHEMVEQVDAGAALRTLDWPLRERDNLDRVITETKRAGARLMIDALRRMHAGTIRATPLDWSKKQYFGFPKPEDAQAFRTMGHRML